MADAETLYAYLSQSAEELSLLIAEEIKRQNNEIDDLGDAESILFMSECPIINLVELAEHIINREPQGYEHHSRSATADQQSSAATKGS